VRHLRFDRRLALYAVCTKYSCINCDLVFFKEQESLIKFNCCSILALNVIEMYPYPEGTVLSFLRVH